MIAKLLIAATAAFCVAGCAAFNDAIDRAGLGAPAPSAEHAAAAPYHSPYLDYLDHRQHVMDKARAQWQDGLEFCDKNWVRYPEHKAQCRKKMTDYYQEFLQEMGDPLPPPHLSDPPSISVTIDQPSNWDWLTKDIERRNHPVVCDVYGSMAFC